MNPNRLLLYFGIALIGIALFVIRWISPAFHLTANTTTADHPVGLFTLTLVLANIVWLLFLPVLQSWTGGTSSTAASGKPSKSRTLDLWILLGLALVFRGLFLGSTPIYEDDWNRYLWDGLVVSEGMNPYEFSPRQIYDGGADPRLGELRQLSLDHTDPLARINNPGLTTIYPPVAQGAFAAAASLAPASLDALRAFYLLIEAITFLLMIWALRLYGRSPMWALLYAFNPLLIYASFNAAHMDILLCPFLLLVIGCQRVATRDFDLPMVGKKRSATFLAGLGLVGAIGVKLWPLVVAPVVFRRTMTRRPLTWIGVAIWVVLLSAALLYPMLHALGQNGSTSGLRSYSEEWRLGSFVFPWLERVIGLFVFDPLSPGRVARIAVAAVVTLTSLWFCFFRRGTDGRALPLHLLIVTLMLLFLSPTGYPWYLVWALVFLPFAPLYGVALLSVLLPLYYVRFTFMEQNMTHIYNGWLVPIQFAVPLAVLAVEGFRGLVKPSPQPSSPQISSYKAK